MSFAQTGFFVLATHKSLKVTFWTRTRDFLKDILLYGSVNWRRASDELQPPRLSPTERKMAMPTKNLEVIKPRHNPQAALIKTLPKKPLTAKLPDVTAGAIVSDPLLESDGPTSLPKQPLLPKRAVAEIEPAADEAGVEGDGQIIVRRRRRHHRGSLLAKRAPRSVVQYNDSKPGLLARLFGTK